MLLYKKLLLMTFGTTYVYSHPVQSMIVLMAKQTQ